MLDSTFKVNELLIIIGTPPFTSVKSTPTYHNTTQCILQCYTKHNTAMKMQENMLSCGERAELQSCPAAVAAAVVAVVVAAAGAAAVAGAGPGA